MVGCIITPTFVKINGVHNIVCEGQMDDQLYEHLFILYPICPFYAVSDEKLNKPVQIPSLGVADAARFTHKPGVSEAA